MPGATTEKREFLPDMTVGQALGFRPAARWVFAAYHIGGCSQCSMSEEETLAQLAQGYGLSLDKLIHDLNALLTS